MHYISVKKEDYDVVKMWLISLEKLDIVEYNAIASVYRDNYIFGIE